MASTYSDLKFELIGTGEQSGTWGVTTNTNLGTAIEEAITGSADVTFASATVTLTLTDTNASQTARNLRLNLTGTSGGAQDLVVPAIEKFYIVNNGCADAITVKVSGQTGVAVPAGKAMLLFNNGTDVVDAVNHFNTASVGTLTLTNALAVAQGGTGATTASGARTNLGSGAVGDNLFTAATAAAAQQAMDTEVGVDVQAYDAGLADISGLAVTDGNFIVGDGANWVAESGATARTSLGLGDLATLSSVNASTIDDNSVGAAELNVSGNGTAGQLLESDGDGTFTWVDASGGGGVTGYAAYTSSGTFTVPAGVTAAYVEVIGAGGGGGGARVNPESSSSAGSGGGGGYAAEWVDLTGVPSVTVTVGNGGSGGAPAANGGTGGTSSFGSYLSATGGGGGQGGTNLPSGTGGTAGNGSGGSLNAVGNPGTRGGPATMGGNVFKGGVGKTSLGSNQNGAAATQFGAGGTGAVTGDVNPNNRSGGAGKSGLVTIIY